MSEAIAVEVAVAVEFPSEARQFCIQMSRYLTLLAKWLLPILAKSTGCEPGMVVACITGGAAAWQVNFLNQPKRIFRNGSKAEALNWQPYARAR